MTFRSEKSFGGALEEREEMGNDSDRKACLARSGAAPSPRSRGDAFTLIEILVALAVFLLMALLLLQMSDSIMQVTNHSQHRIGADGNALLAMDRISDDVTRAVVRGDLPWRVQKQPGNDGFSFFAAARAYTAGRTTSKIGYKVEDSMLKRGVQETSWENSGTDALTFIPAGSPDFTDYLEIDATNFDVLDPNIFRLEISFLNAEGDVISDPAPTDNNLVDFSQSRSVEPQNTVRAIIVTVASVNERARLLISPAELDALPDNFPDASNGKNALEAWQDYLASGATNLSQPAREAIRVRQRYIPIAP